jgi:hypothetical protein
MHYPYTFIKHYISQFIHKSNQVVAFTNLQKFSGQNKGFWYNCVRVLIGDPCILPIKIVHPSLYVHFLELLCSW